MPQPNVGLLIGPGDIPRMVYHSLAPLIRFVVQETPPSRLQVIRRRIRKLGIVHVAGQLLFQVGMVPLLRRTSRARLSTIRKEYGLHDAPIPPHLLRFVQSVNDRECIDHVRSCAPQVLVICGTRILSREFLEMVNVPVLNIHAGLTPRYRGVHGGFWALAEGHPDRCGVTVHRVDAGIDSGPIVDQVMVEPSPEDNFTTYPYLQTAAALPLLKRAVESALRNELATRAAVGESRLYSHPTITQYLAARMRLGVR